MTDLRIQHAIDAIDDAQDELDSDLAILRVLRFVLLILPVSIAMAVYGFLAPVGDVRGSVIGCAGLGCSAILLLVGVPFWIFSRDEVRMSRKKLRDAQRKLRDLQLEAMGEK